MFDVLIRFSITCTTLFEVRGLTNLCSRSDTDHLQFITAWLSYQHASENGFGWFCRRLGPFSIFALVLLRFLPLVRYSHSAIGFMYANEEWRVHERELHFWTGIVASLCDLSFFSVVYWSHFFKLQLSKKRERKIGFCAGLYSAAASSALVTLVIGEVFTYLRSLLFVVSYRGRLS